MALENFSRIDMKINKANDHYIDTQFAKEGDYNGRELVVQITNAGEIESQHDVSLNLGWRHNIVGNSGLTPFEEEDVSKGIFKIIYPNAMLNAGNVTAFVQIVENDKVINTRDFVIEVENNTLNARAIILDDSFETLNKALTTVKQYDGRIESLENNKADRSFVDSQFSAIVSGAPKGTYTDLNALKIAYPNGTDGVMLVLEDGHWYYWQSTTGEWTDGGIYQASIESDFPAKNLINNPLFENDRRYWQLYGATANITDGLMSLTSTGQKTMRLTHASTGYKPKKNDKLLIGGIINFEDDNFLEAKINLRDWVTGGTYHFEENLDVSRYNVDQQVYAYVEVDRDFVDQLRFYIEAKLIGENKQSSFTFKKPIILNLTQIFGQGNEPPKSQVIELLRNNDGWIQDKVDEFLTKKESKLIGLDGQNLAEIATEKVNAITKDEVLKFSNLILNGNFENINFLDGNNWNRNGVANTNAINYIATFNATAPNQSLLQTVPVKANHVLYFWAQVKATSPLVSIRANGNLNASKAHSGSGEFEFLSSKYIRNTDAGANIEIRDARTSGYDDISVKYVGAMDLTEIFGYGFEPEVYVMDEYIKRLPNMWFEGTKDDVLSLEEIHAYYENEKRKKHDLAMFKSQEQTRYAERNVPKIAMTITYDDESSSIYDLALPIHRSENVPAKFYVIPSRIGTRQVYNYNVAEDWHRIKEMNDEGLITIEHHTYTHGGLDNRTKESMEWEFDRSNEIFWRNEIYPRHLAYPGGAHDFNTINVLQDYVETATTTSPVVSGYDMNPMHLHRLGMDNRTMDEIKAFIDQAVESGGWLITYQHDLAASGFSLGASLPVRTPSEQLEIIQYAKSKGVVFVSLEEGLEMYKPHVFVQKPDDLEKPSFAIQRNGVVVNNSN